MVCIPLSFDPTSSILKMFVPATTQPSAPEIGYSDSLPNDTTLPPSQQADDGIQDEYMAESDPCQPDELNELDELDDRELVAYDDMYPID